MPPRIQAPDSPSQKRKRGRPPNASHVAEDASHPQPDAPEPDAEEQQRPRKRGRPRKSLDSVGSAVPSPAEPTKPRKRVRPSLGERAKEAPASRDDDADAASVDKTKKKRGRPSLQKQKVDAVVQGDDERRPDQRPLGADRDENEVDAQRGKERQQQRRKSGEPLAKSDAPRKKRGRRSLKEAEETQQQQSKPRKRGRPSLKDLSPAAAQNRTGRPSQADKEDAAPEPAKKKRGRPSGSRNSLTAKPAAAESEARRRRSDQSQQSLAAEEVEAEEADEADDLPSPPKPYPHIAPAIHRVKQSTIDAKWSPLAEPSLAAASSILRLAHVPILQRLSSTEKRRTHSAAALALTTKRVLRKILRGLPFPPASIPATARGAASGGGDADGREAELDFESVLDARAALERQLDPALDAVEVLGRERRRVEVELDKDYAALRNLESGARAQVREQKAMLKKAHVLAPKKSRPQDTDHALIFRDKRDDENLGNVFKVMPPFSPCKPRAPSADVPPPPRISRIGMCSLWQPSWAATWTA